MRMLVISPQPFFTPRGTPFSVYYRALVMAEQGVGIDLLTYGAGEDVDIPGVRIVRIPRVRFLEPIPVGPSWQKSVLDMLMLLWTIGLLLKHRHSVVHAHEESVFWCRFLKPLFRFRLIYDMHSSLPQQLTNFRFTKSRFLIGAFKWLEDDALQRGRCGRRDLPGSARLRRQHRLVRRPALADRELDLRRRPPEEKGRSDASGASAQTFDPRTPVILYAGTFEAYQGIDVLVRAFAYRRGQARRCALVARGRHRGAGEPHARARDGAWGLTDVCVLTGVVPKAQATALHGGRGDTGFAAAARHETPHSRSTSSSRAASRSSRPEFGPTHRSSTRRCAVSSTRSRNRWPTACCSRSTELGARDRASTERARSCTNASTPGRSTRARSGGCWKSSPDVRHRRHCRVARERRRRARNCHAHVRCDGASRPGRRGLSRRGLRRRSACAACRSSI